ncbi:hypothetical protein SEVIR_4G224901v4 [Setaria viridis]|uniref:Uncharacterized protein n=1 Tax=Setaria viridis TaxID=4556 RepID=A0A4U6V3G1_SETVI|nr:hypothetical protein SEVIR_4G224901v2 [Setaria viridis]
MCLVVLLQRHRKALQRKGLAHSLTKKFLRNCSPVKRLKMAMVRLEMTMVALMAAQAPLVRTASSLQHFIHVKHVSWGLGSCKLSVDQLNLEWDKIVVCRLCNMLPFQLPTCGLHFAYRIINLIFNRDIGK